MTTDRRTGSAAVIVLLIILLLLAAGTLGVVLVGVPAGGPSVTAARTWNVERQREWAGKLLARGLQDEAVGVYESIIASGEIPDVTLASISLSIGKIHADRQRYEKAVAALDRAALLTTSDEQKGEINRLLVTCLERLGRSADAAFELKKAAAPGTSKVEGSDGGETLAEAGDVKVTRRDLEEALKRLPANAASQFQSRDGRRELVQSLLASRVLYSKARNLGLDKNQEVRASVEDAEKQIVVSRYLHDEVTAKVKVDAKDVETYFQANKKRYDEPARLKLAHVAVKDAARADELRAAIAAGTMTFEDAATKESQDAETAKTGGVIAQEIVEGGYHPTFPTVADVFTAVGDAPAGSLAAGVVRAGGYHHVLKVVARTPGREHTFTEMRERVTRDYKHEKEQSGLEELVDSTLKAAGARIHEDRLGGDAPAPTTRPEK